MESTKLENLLQLDFQVRENYTFERIILDINGGGAVNASVGEVELEYVFMFRVKNPIFPDFVFFVKELFRFHLLGGVAGREDFDDQIGGTEAAFVVQFIEVADDANIWLHNGENFFICFG